MERGENRKSIESSDLWGLGDEARRRLINQLDNGYIQTGGEITWGQAFSTFRGVTADQANADYRGLVVALKAPTIDFEPFE